MFTGKLLIVLAVLALVVQHEVKCTMMDEFMDLVGLSATLIDDAAAYDEGTEKNKPIESSTHAKTAAEVNRKAEIDEAILSGTNQGIFRSADQFVGFDRLQIRDATSGCYLFWLGGSGTTHNAEFRCNENKGDIFWIEKHGNDYSIGFDNCPLFWKGGSGTTSLNAEFRCGENGDTFWIRQRGDETWAIGYNHCPLYAHGSGGTRNAAFECGKPIRDGFLIIGRSADQFVGFDRLQIRDASSGCYLFWLGGSGTTKNAEFRCNEDQGDIFWIEKRDNDYLIGYDNCPLFWKGGRPGTTSLNAEFRCGENGDTFWIRQRGDKTWAIGHNHCPLYAHGSGGTRNAAFECGKPIRDGFLIIDRSADQFIGFRTLQFGYGDVSNNCYLHLHRGSSKINAEFRCNKDEGDTFTITSITPAGGYMIENHKCFNRCKKNNVDKFNITSITPASGYKIANYKCFLYSNDDSGITKNAEFRCPVEGNFGNRMFWIRRRKDKKWAIGYDNCPLYVSGDSGDTKNAEFRCGLPIKDVFWVTDYSADKFIGYNTIQIRYGGVTNGCGCYLFWLGGSGTTKNAEFRCKKSKGDRFYIKKQENGYLIGYYIGHQNIHCLLHWKGGGGTTRNAEFRCGETGDKFWIRQRNDYYWSIGFDECPMYARGGSGDTKNAEFRCQQPSSEKFWIAAYNSGKDLCNKWSPTSTDRYTGPSENSTGQKVSGSG